MAGGDDSSTRASTGKRDHGIGEVGKDLQGRGVHPEPRTEHIPKGLVHGVWDRNSIVSLGKEGEGSKDRAKPCWGLWEGKVRLGFGKEKAKSGFRKEKVRLGFGKKVLSWVWERKTVQGHLCKAGLSFRKAWPSQA